MRSSSGQHYIVLDQLRGIAAFLVVMWHFMHSANGSASPVPYQGPTPILAFIDEGHVGVALFMTLSGYLFAKLCDGKDIIYPAFLANRALRLFPLLFGTFALIAVLSYFRMGTALPFLVSVLKGFALPLWPNGGWSVAIELQFYLLFPILMWFSRRSTAYLLAFVFLGILVRANILHFYGTVQTAAYFTIAGRMDQFLFGIMAFYCREQLARVPALLAMTVLGFAVFYYWFDLMGGFRDFNGMGYPSRSTLWVVLPTVEGLAFGVIVALCDLKFPAGLPLPRIVGAAGVYSYSIYLLHFWFVDGVAAFLDRYNGISNFYPALAAGTAFFVVMVGIGRLSYRCIELPFLAYRLRYIRKPSGPDMAVAPSTLDPASESP